MREQDEDFGMDNEERIPPRLAWQRLVIGLVALVAIGSLLYLSGIHQYFFLHRTPAGAEQRVLPSKVQGEILTVPVTAHILSGSLGSGRTDEDARRLVANANAIWAQANIAFEIRDVRYIAVDHDDLVLFEAAPHAYIEQHGSYDAGAVNVYLTRTLAGVNGLAYGGTSAVSVADYTSTLDFRTLAHEFGHVLGLGHVPDSGQLMSTGATGVDLAESEIQTAREIAERLAQSEP